MNPASWLDKNWLFCFAFVLIFWGGSNSFHTSFFSPPPDQLSDSVIEEPSPSEETAINIPPYPNEFRYLHPVNTTVQYHWTLAGYSDTFVSCDIYMKGSETPEDKDILGFCGLETYKLWAEQQTCLNEQGVNCTNISLRYAARSVDQLETSIKFAGPVAYAYLDNCSAWGECTQKPKLSFNASEPLQSEHIETVYVIFESGDYVACTQLPCEVEMPPTTEDGIKISYYATSSYGDRSYSRDFRMRNLSLGKDKYLFQVMGEFWWSEIPAAISQWEYFPTMEETKPSWLKENILVGELSTTNDYALLAGKLILQGSVSAAHCNDGGLLENGFASPCGVLAAKEKVTEIQNSLDIQIYQAAIESRIPPRLLKGVIAQESQFWNGWVISGEYGYGMLTDNGVDMLLTWNLPFFLNICTPVYGEDGCAWGYTNMASYPRAYLRGLSLQKVGTDDEFVLIGETLAASTGQAGQLVRNITGQQPGYIMEYEDLWMVSLGIYNGGAGCVGTAIQGAWEANEPLNWGNISEYLPGECEAIGQYPYQVMQYTE